MLGSDPNPPKWTICLAGSPWSSQVTISNRFQKSFFAEIARFELTELFWSSESFQDSGLSRSPKSPIYKKQKIQILLKELGFHYMIFSIILFSIKNPILPYHYLKWRFLNTYHEDYHQKSFLMMKTK